MIQTWIADVSRLWEEEIYQIYYGQVSRERRQKADRLRFQRDRALSIGAGVLLEKMREHYGLPEDVLYNLSHSGIYALCSVAESQDEVTRLGCDVEQRKEPRLSVAKRFFCQEEYQELLNFEGEKQREMFYRYWVWKESFMKATRQGMKLGLDTFSFTQNEKNEVILKKCPKEYLDTYYWKEYQVENEKEQYQIAVCANRDVFASDLIKIQL